MSEFEDDNCRPLSIYDSLTTINFEELAEQEEWEAKFGVSHVAEFAASAHRIG